jgi:Tfp pilus assembly protein PilF
VAAEGHFLAARERNPKSPDAYYGLAIYYQRAARTPDARDAFAHALARDPERGALAALGPEYPELVALGPMP